MHFFFFFGCLPVWEWDPQEVNSWDISRSESMNWRKGKEMSAMSWHDNRNIILHILRLNAQRWFELCSQIIYDNRWRLQGGVYLKRMRIRWRVLVSRVFACNFLSVEQNKNKQTIPQAVIDTVPEHYMENIIINGFNEHQGVLTDIQYQYLWLFCWSFMFSHINVNSD